MRSDSTVGRLLGRVVVPLAVLLAAACNSKTAQTPTGPTPPPTPGQPVSYAAVGASDAIGVGASVPCIPFSPCPDGTGYVQTIARQLGANNTPVTLTNLGIPAAVIEPDIQAIGVQYGRTIPGNFLDQEMPFVPRNSTVVTIFAGGNDTNTIAAAIGGGAGGSDPLGYLNAQIKAFGNDYSALVSGIRDRAPSARIVIANLPNVAGMPFTAGYALDRRQLVQKISVGFTTQAINGFASQGIPVVDLMCDPRFQSASIYSSDGFHPNDAGYAALAELMLRAITSTSYPAPQASCPQMTVVPPI